MRSTKESTDIETAACDEARDEHVQNTDIYPASSGSPHLLEVVSILHKDDNCSDYFRQTENSVTEEFSRLLSEHLV